MERVVPEMLQVHRDEARFLRTQVLRLEAEVLRLSKEAKNAFKSQGRSKPKRNS